MRTRFRIVAFATFTAVAIAASARANDALEAVYDAALAGDGEKALAALSAIDLTTLNSAEFDRAGCIRGSMLVTPQPAAIPRNSNKVLLVYRTYWQQSMMHKLPQAEAEDRLKNGLIEIETAAGDKKAKGYDLTAATTKAKQIVERDGLFALTGITLPYYELTIWKTQSSKNYVVDLHDRRVTTKVVFLDGFVSYGWSGFATCNRYHTAGWATDKALFVVKSAYDLASEDFMVSYLAHESRHFSDYGRFPKLEPPELEYRAKLTELSLANDTSHSLITTFSRRTGNDRSVPHAYANFWVVTNLSQQIFHSDAIITDGARWDQVPPADIRAAATQLLATNDTLLLQRQPRTVQRFLGE